jgi:hypothetical protein
MSLKLFVNGLFYNHTLTSLASQHTVLRQLKYEYFAHGSTAIQETYVRELCTYKNMSYYWKGSKLPSATYILLKLEDKISITKIIRIVNDTVAVNGDDNVT